MAVRWERMSVLCSSSVHAHLEEEDRTMQGARHCSATLVTVEKTPLQGQFPNLYKIRLPDLILKCEMVQCDETAAIPSASPDTLPLDWAGLPVIVRLGSRTSRKTDTSR